jgi:uncharacterized membrane protein
VGERKTRLRWPPPPETAEVKKEQIKLTCGLANAVAIAAIVTALVGPVITMIPDEELGLDVRIALFVFGAALHIAARTYLRYMSLEVR